MSMIDVVMPVHNGAVTISESIDSILAQSFSDFRLFVIDDHSTDNTKNIVESFAELDSRVVMLTSPGSGIVPALNEGIAAGRAPFVARMDADDISERLRFELQLAFLIKNPDVVLLGTAISIFGASTAAPPVITGNESCKLALRLFSPFCHPTVIMRRAAIDKIGGYRDKYPHAEDYDLFTRLSSVGDINNISARLLRYRSHPNQISVVRRRDQRDSARSISRDYLATFGASNMATQLVASLTAMSALGPMHYRPSLRSIRNHLIWRQGR